MTLITKTLTVALILAATTSAGSAFAQSAPTPELSAAHINDWILKKTSAQNQSFILQTDIEDEAALFTPLPEQNPERFVKIETPIYSKTDISNFNYPLLGPVNLAVQSDYQELLWSNNTIHISDITYVTPDSSPYSQTPYQVATTATAQVKFIF